MYLNWPSWPRVSTQSIDVVSTSRDDFYNLSVKIPPLPIQRRIADILSALDDKIEVNHRYDLKDAAAAHAALQGRQTTGSTVLKV